MRSQKSFKRPPSDPKLTQNKAKLPSRGSKSIRKKVRKMMKALLLIGLLGTLITLLARVRVHAAAAHLVKPQEEVQNAGTALVLGAYVYPDGQPCPLLQDRLDTALDLYRQGHVKKFLLSGDHGSADYDEVNSMKNYLISKGVSPEVLYLDHAGFDTYDSLYRAKHIFEADRVVVVTQLFHLRRALFIGRSLGLEVEGVAADRRRPEELLYLQLRELGANLKAVWEVGRKRQALCMGSPISLNGPASVTHN